MESTIYSVIPPILAIIMVIATRRVLLSLGVGIVASALFLAEFNIMEGASIIWNAITGLVISDGALNTSNVYIIIFLLLLGVITAFISISGGSKAFGDWAMKRVKTRAGAQLVGAVLGMLLFIDDYFNALAVGQVTRPVTDRHKVSRAKLAYIIDSTSAPVCVISPVSSWGAYIIVIIGGILTTHQITGMSAFSAFIQMVPMNFYVWVTLFFVFMVSLGKLDIGPMKKHEERAMVRGELFDPAKPIPGELKEDLPVSQSGKIGDLVWPIVGLFAGTLGAMFWTGYQAVAGDATLLKIFENTNVTLSLLLGGLSGVIVAIALFFRQLSKGDDLKGGVFWTGMIAGMKSMMPAIYILLFAWMIGDLIGRLETGAYLADVVQNSNLDISLLPVILFIIAGGMAFATGTSWGSFGILLPIAGEMAAASDISLLLPAMAAVLAGAVFGDHCSPISDTTILSSTGAGSNHMDHVMTQLPYALMSAAISIVGFIMIGYTGSTLVSLASVFILGAAVLLVARKKPSLGKAFKEDAVR